MHRELMEELMLKSNLVMKNLMQLAILSILATVFLQVDIVNLPLLKDATLHGENLEDSYPCLHVKQFL